MGTATSIAIACIRMDSYAIALPPSTPGHSRRHCTGGTLAPPCHSLAAVRSRPATVAAAAAGRPRLAGHSVCACRRRPQANNRMANNRMGSCPLAHACCTALLRLTATATYPSPPPATATAATTIDPAAATANAAVTATPPPLHRHHNRRHCHAAHAMPLSNAEKCARRRARHAERLAAERALASATRRQQQAQDVAALSALSAIMSGVSSMSPAEGPTHAQHLQPQQQPQQLQQHPATSFAAAAASSGATGKLLPLPPSLHPQKCGALSASHIAVGQLVAPANAALAGAMPSDDSIASVHMSDVAATSSEDAAESVVLSDTSYLGASYPAATVARYRRLAAAQVAELLELEAECMRDFHGDASLESERRRYRQWEIVREQRERALAEGRGWNPTMVDGPFRSHAAHQRIASYWPPGSRSVPRSRFAAKFEAPYLIYPAMYSLPDSDGLPTALQWDGPHASLADFTHWATTHVPPPLGSETLFRHQREAMRPLSDGELLVYGKNMKKLAQPDPDPEWHALKCSRVQLNASTLAKMHLRENRVSAAQEALLMLRQLGVPDSVIGRLGQPPPMAIQAICPAGHLTDPELPHDLQPLFRVGRQLAARRGRLTARTVFPAIVPSPGRPWLPEPASQLAEGGPTHAYLIRDLMYSGYPGCPAIVLASSYCTMTECACATGFSSRPAGRGPVTQRQLMQEQALSLPFAPAYDLMAVPPAIVPDGLVPLPITDPERDHYGVRQARRLDLVDFMNRGALSYLTCSSCYRYVIQHKDHTGELPDYRRAGKGGARYLSSRADLIRMQSLMPDVVADLLRLYNKRHGSQHTVVPDFMLTSMWICGYCAKYLDSKDWRSYPPRCMQNHLLLPDVPLELSCLTQYERHLIARVRCFIQLVYLPYGQSASRGLSISYPSDTRTIINSLPTTLADSDVVIVRQAQDNSTKTRQLTQTEADAQDAAAADLVIESDAAGSLPSNPAGATSSGPVKVPLQYLVHPWRLRVALIFLMHHNELYYEIRITDNLNSDLSDRSDFIVGDGELGSAVTDAEVLVQSDSDSDSDADDSQDASYVPTRSSGSTASTHDSACSASSGDRCDIIMDHVTSVDPAPSNLPMCTRERLQQIGVSRTAARIPIMQIQRADGKPIRINYQKAAEAMAYPAIFCSGQNHYGTERRGTGRLYPLEYFRSRLMAYRERCMADPTYLFFVMNIIDWYELERQVNVAFKMQSGGGHGQRPSASVVSNAAAPAVSLTREQLSQHASQASVVDRYIDDMCFSFMRSVRGTIAYWNKCKRDVFSMIRMLGPPTWFITLSADEFGWIECLMSAGNLSREEAERLTRKEKEELISKNPDRVSQYFSYRFNAFFRIIMNSKKGAPLGVIKDYFWRVEFQRRGSPHIHMVLWIEDAPVLEHESDREKVVDFIGRYVSTEIPQEPGPLKTLVESLQVHKHTPTCSRTKLKKGPLPGCRFCFPRAQQSHTRLTTPEDKGLPRRTIYVTKRRAGDEFVNAYNPALLLAWRGNMDIQYISSIQGIVAYVCGYMTKSEPEGFRVSIQKAVAALPPDASKRTKLMRMGSAMLSKRELPAQEACYRMFGLDLRHSSRTFVHVDTRPPSQRMRILKPRWQDEADESTDLFMTNPIQRYMQRPRNDPAPQTRDAADWERMSLAHFVANYTLARKPPAIVNEDGATGGFRVRRSGYFKVGNQWIRKRLRLACIETSGMTPEKNGEDYYYSLLLLHVPFRDEADLMVNPQDGTRFQSPKESVLWRTTHGEFRSVDTESMGHRHFAAEMRQLHAMGDLDPESVAYSDMQHFSDMADRELQSIPRFDIASAESHADDNDARHAGVVGFDGVEGDPEAIAAGMADDVAAGGDRPRGGGEYTASFEELTTVNPNPLMSDEDYYRMISQLNVEQKAIFDHVDQHCNRLYLPDQYPHDGPLEPLRMFISGGGGTGKSFLLRALRERIGRATSNQGCLVCAPTGVAAFNVGGRTIHGALAIPVDQRYQGADGTSIEPLNGARLKEKRALMASVDYMIVDEISMVSAAMLRKMHTRLEQFKSPEVDRFGNVTQTRRGRSSASDPASLLQSSFGGMSMIVVGDLCQLRPVLGRYVFEGTDQTLWGQFQLFELTVNERQAEDARWCRLLNNLRLGTPLSVEDELTLRSRLTIGARLEMPRVRPAHLVDVRPDHPALDGDPSRGIDVQRSKWMDALRIFPTNAECIRYNEHKTASMDQNGVHRFDAQHTLVSHGQLPAGQRSVPKSWIPSSDDDCGGLPKTLRLGVGSRVMLRRNINIADGLVNGATGVVTGFEWVDHADGQQEEGQLPLSVLVKFDNPRVGRMDQRRVLTRDTQEHGSVAIYPACAKFEGVGSSTRRTLQRFQLPLMLCWAATVHKVQGLTLDRVVVDISNTFSAAMVYVALSRVRKLKHLALSGFAPPGKIAWQHKCVGVEYERLRESMFVLPVMGTSQAARSSRTESVRRGPNPAATGPTLNYDTVDSVIGKRRVPGQGLWEYKVRWTTHPDQADSWHAAAALRDVSTLVKTFNTRLRLRGLKTGTEPLPRMRSNSEDRGMH